MQKGGGGMAGGAIEALDVNHPVKIFASSIYDIDDKFGYRSSSILILLFFLRQSTSARGLTIAEIAKLSAIPVASTRVNMMKLKASGLVVESMRVGRSALYEISDMGGDRVQAIIDAAMPGAATLSEDEATRR